MWDNNNQHKGKHIFCYRLSPETFGYTLVGMSLTVISHTDPDDRDSQSL